MATLIPPARPFLRGLGLLGAALALLPPAKAAGAPRASLEYAVKANYLYKFAPFVRWPPDSIAPGSPFSICLVGANGFGTMIDEAVRGQAVDGRPIAIRRIGSAAGLGGCQILFVGRTARASSILRAAAASPILTVTDHDHAGGGGMIDFRLHSGRVRFVIDDAAARASGLQISSKLLSLALAVNGR
jgi:hypothetical protein